MLEYLGLLLFSFVCTFLLLYFLVPRLKRAGMTGKDINKPEKPEVAEMGGLGIVAGMTCGVLVAVFMNTFMGFQFNLLYVLAALITIHSVAFIGVIDDIVDIPQKIKAFLPILAAVPLIAISAAGSTSLTLPLVGTINFGLLYLFILVPIGVAVASNLTNMFAGFNGMEAGMGIVIFVAASIIAITHGNMEMLVLFLPMLGALLAFFPYNRYPAKVFPGDVGNLSIGAVLAAGVIIGNFETAGAILLLPYVADFFIKLANKFPSRMWWGEYRDGKLYPVEGKVRGLAQMIMKIKNGTTERELVAIFISIEIVVAAVTVLMFWK